MMVWDLRQDCFIALRRWMRYSPYINTPRMTDEEWALVER
jgi:hypothetical protein